MSIIWYSFGNIFRLVFLFCKAGFIQMRRLVRLFLLCSLFLSSPLSVHADNPFADIERPVKIEKVESAPIAANAQSSSGRFLKYEVYSKSSFASRKTSRNLFHNALGIEYLNRFSDSFATRSSFNLQLQLVHQNSSDFDFFGHKNKKEWKSDIHNLYFDFFQALDPFMSESARRKNLGRFNLRVGRFYLPFGLNIQTDTHATLLQLANEEHFGYDRDWYAGFYGAINDDLKYDLYWMLGSGHDAVYKDQKGLTGLRISLAGKYLYQSGIEGGIAYISGERLSHDISHGKLTDTKRLGIDARYTKALRVGTAKVSAESAIGKDDEQHIKSLLIQAELLDPSRKNGFAAQYRAFERSKGKESMMIMPHQEAKNGNDASLFLEYTRYLQNDVNGNRMEWIKILFEKPLETRLRHGNPKDSRFTVQYYSYF